MMLGLPGKMVGLKSSSTSFFDGEQCGFHVKIQVELKKLEAENAARFGLMVLATVGVAMQSSLLGSQWN